MNATNFPSGDHVGLRPMAPPLIRAVLPASLRPPPFHIHDHNLVHSNKLAVILCACFRDAEAEAPASGDRNVSGALAFPFETPTDQKSGYAGSVAHEEQVRAVGRPHRVCIQRGRESDRPRSIHLPQAGIYAGPWRSLPEAAMHPEIRSPAPNMQCSGHPEKAWPGHLLHSRASATQHF